MYYASLGQTGFNVSRMGLGCGGHSRLGLRSHGSNEEAAKIVREAIDLGVNFIDTAETYGTEEAVGIGLKGVDRDQVYLSTKVGATWGDRMTTPAELREKLNGCLTRLKTEYVDVFYLHGVRLEEYAYARDALLPCLIDLKVEGKIRSVGITEAFIPEPSHAMLAPAVQADGWEVVMVGFNLLNQSARKTILPDCLKRGIGTLCMFAVRRALSQPDALREVIQTLIEHDEIDQEDFTINDPLGFLTEDGVAESIQEAAYRYCLWEPGLDIILSGTGNLDHLRENVKSLSKPPLPPEIIQKLNRLFAKVDSVSGN